MLVVDGIRTNGGVDPLVDPGTLAAAAPEDVQATFCSVLVDTWIGLGSTMAFVAPGSRSTPLALALVSDPRMRVDVLHDERSVAFAALGYGVATGRAAVAVCTSGTAAAHFHAAVIEADLSGVPLLICTADRPPELRDVGHPRRSIRPSSSARRPGGSMIRACRARHRLRRGDPWRRGRSLRPAVSIRDRCM